MAKLSALRSLPRAVESDREVARGNRDEARWAMALDTETVPDTDLVSEEEARERFPKPIHHRIAAISFSMARIEGVRDDERLILDECRSGGDEATSERDLIRGFWSFFERHRPRVVTWHGRGFDMQVLRMRSLVHGIAAPYWHQAGDKWNNYQHRYAPDWHCDLMDVLSDHRAGPSMSLREFAEAIGIPGKINGSGPEVLDMWKEGRIGDVRGYCEIDSLSLLGGYVRWRHLSGAMSAESHDASMQSILDYVEREAPQRQSMAKFLEVWKSSPRPCPIFVGKSAHAGGEAAE